MKHIVLLISSLLFLNACTPTDNSSPVSETSLLDNSANCPTPPDNISPAPIGGQENFFNGLDYEVLDIIPSQDTIRFQTPNYDFVFCRGNATWTVQPATTAATTNQSYDEFLAEATDPSYQSIELNGETYQYRVLLQPNPFPDFSQEAQEVVFEFIPPDSDTPQQQTLYTLDQVEAAQAGIQLGLPEISAAETYEKQIFWSVLPEQGEGNGGIATIVRYQVESDSLDVIQPEGLEQQQITDLAITPNGDEPTLWLGTKIAGEGNPYIPSLGLVSYDLGTKTFETYGVRNSPLVGAIPYELKTEGETLWLGTGNGICQVNWQNLDNSSSWSCWRVALFADVPDSGLPLYPSLLASTSGITLQPEQIEVLWWLPQDYESSQGRYEVRYADGFSTTLEEGYTPWSEIYPGSTPPAWLSPVFWAGQQWHWQGNRFVRGLDEVELNYVGGGPLGISNNEFSTNQRQDMNAIRGDLELVELTPNSTSLIYYSGWVEESLLSPIPTLIPVEPVENPQPNPLP